MSRDLGLEQRFRRVLRLLPGYYRDKWEEKLSSFSGYWPRLAEGSGDIIVYLARPSCPGG